MHLDVCGSSPFIVSIVQHFPAWINHGVLVPRWGRACFHSLTIAEVLQWEFLHISRGHLQSLSVLVSGVFSGCTVEATLPYFAYGRSVFPFLRSCQITFQGVCAVLYFSQQRMWVPVVPVLTNTWCCVSNFSHPDRVRVSHRMALTCLSLMAVEAEHLFGWLLAINICSWQSVLNFCQLFIGWLSFY